MAGDDNAREGGTRSGWELLRTRNFGLLFAGQVASQIGDSMNKVALLWFVYELTGSAFKMTVIGLLQTIPPLVFGPALASAVPLMVSRTQLTSANALIQGTGNIGLLIGPAIGGLGIAMIGAQNVLY